MIIYQIAILLFQFFIAVFVVQLITMPPADLYNYCFWIVGIIALQRMTSIINRLQAKARERTFFSAHKAAAQPISDENIQIKVLEKHLALYEMYGELHQNLTEWAIKAEQALQRGDLQVIKQLSEAFEEEIHERFIRE